MSIHSFSLFLVMILLSVIVLLLLSLHLVMLLLLLIHLLSEFFLDDLLMQSLISFLHVLGQLAAMLLARVALATRVSSVLKNWLRELIQMGTLGLVKMMGMNELWGFLGMMKLWLQKGSSTLGSMTRSILGS
jgi:hypothetical protein